MRTFTINYVMSFMQNSSYLSKHKLFNVLQERQAAYPKVDYKEQTLKLAF